MTTAASERNRTLSWSEAFFGSDRAIGLAVCVRHQGAHVWVLDRVDIEGVMHGWCQVIPSGLSARERARIVAKDHPIAVREPVLVEIEESSLLAALRIIEASRAPREERRGEPVKPAPPLSASSRRIIDLADDEP